MRRDFFLVASTAICFVLSGQSLLVADVLIHFEDFEDDDGFVTSIPQFSDGDSDYFIRTDGSNISSSVNISNVQGSFFFAGQDLDGQGAALPLSLTLDPISISGFTKLVFQGLFAEDDDGTSQDIDKSDFLLLEYSIDGGPFNNLLAFENDGSTFNSAFFQDTDFDGTGDGAELTDTLSAFSAPIDATGNSLTIRLTTNLNSGDEDFAIDNFRVRGTRVITPEPSSVVVWMMGAFFPFLIYLRRHRRSAEIYKEC